MKRIAIISFLLISLVIGACSSTGGNNNGNPAEINDGTVNVLTTEQFKNLIWDFRKSPDNLVFKGTLPCIIDFYADWCRPCRMVAPIMDDLAREYKGKIRVYKVNTDQERELASLFRINSIPAVLFIPKTGQPQMTVGALPKSEFLKAVNNILQVK